MVVANERLPLSPSKMLWVSGVADKEKGKAESELVNATGCLSRPCLPSAIGMFDKLFRASECCRLSYNTKHRSSERTEMIPCISNIHPRTRSIFVIMHS